MKSKKNGVVCVCASKLSVYQCKNFFLGTSAGPLQGALKVS